MLTVSSRSDPLFHASILCDNDPLIVAGVHAAIIMGTARYIASSFMRPGGIAIVYYTDFFGLCMAS